MKHKMALLGVVLLLLLAGCSAGDSGTYETEDVAGETPSSMTLLDESGENVSGTLKVVYDSHTDEYCYLYVGLNSDGIDCVPAAELSNASSTPHDGSLTYIGEQSFGGDRIEVVYDEERNVYCHLHIGTVGDDPSCNPASETPTATPTTEEEW